MSIGKVTIFLLVVVVVLVGYAGIALAATFLDSSIPEKRSPAPESAAPEASEPVTVMLWNAGYAGLGEASDFIADGGKMLLPPSKALVQANLAAIVAELRRSDADLVMMQELAGPGLLTHGVDVVGGVRAALPGHAMLFSSDIHTRLMPPFLSLKHGLGMFTRLKLDRQPRLHRLPLEPGATMGLIHRQYHAQIAEADVGGRPWAFVNLHLSAFDEGADTRIEQLRAVMALGEQLHAQGKAVVIGGDWNMMLADTAFPHTSAEEALFWVFRLPENELPPGWKIAADASTPSVRTNERPYRKGENFTTVIDGFILSPNVDTVSVTGVELGFKFTDHQPVIAKFRRND